MRARGRAAETPCMRNLPYLPRVAALLAMLVVASLSATAANASQRLTTHKLPDSASPSDMVVGPDGATWVTSYSQIHRISTSGRIRTYDLGEQPGSIAVAGGSMRHRPEAWNNSSKPSSGVGRTKRRAVAAAVPGPTCSDRPSPCTR